MKIKHIITSGCSFAELCDWNWPFIFEKKIKENNPDVTFAHMGLGSQGNELIQKKSSLALIEALEFYKPEEIALVIMWTGTERKTFYVDNKDFISNVAKGWNEGSHWWGTQFSGLKSEVDKTTYVIDPKTKLCTYYNKNGGWYICNYLMPDSNFTKEFYNLSSTIIGPATVTLENIIMLENTCKRYNVQLYHCFYRNYVYNDIIENKDHQNINYLYKQFDQNNIISTIGLYEYLRPITENYIQWDISEFFKHIFKRGQHTDETKKYFRDDDWHPNELGSTKWTEEVLIPKLTERGFFL